MQLPFRRQMVLLIDIPQILLFLLNNLCSLNRSVVWKNANFHVSDGMGCVLWMFSTSWLVLELLCRLGIIESGNN